MFTIVDDFARNTWIYILSIQSDVIVVIKQHFALIENQFNKTIKMIRTDNGGEHFSNQCDDFFKDKRHYSSNHLCHIPQQNGILERKHRHLLEIA